MTCNSNTASRRLKQSEMFEFWDTSNTCMGQYSLYLLHSLSNQGYFGLRYIAIVATRLLGFNVNLTSSKLASDQAEGQDPWASFGCLQLVGKT